jgi:nicotinamidase-related amidase
VPGSKEAEILQELGVHQHDIIVSKTGGGSFYGTNLDYVLRNLKIEQVIACGITTAGCLETTVREAADRSYKVILVDDACASYWREEHEAAIAAMAIRHACVRSTEAVADRLAEMSDRMTTPIFPAWEKQAP